MNVFTAKIKIVQDSYSLNEEELKQWLEEFFADCDLGEVTVLRVEEIEDDG